VSVYYKLKTSGMQAVTQSKAAISRVNMTAADPKSLALLDKSCCSNEMRSMAASTLEFNNSTTNTKMSDEMRMAFSKLDMRKNSATGSMRASSVSSWRKELSSLKA